MQTYVKQLARAEVSDLRRVCGMCAVCCGRCINDITATREACAMCLEQWYVISIFTRGGWGGGTKAVVIHTNTKVVEEIAVVIESGWCSIWGVWKPG